MNEQNKYEIIKKLVETNGNKLRTATKRTINRRIQKYKESGKSPIQHGNHGKTFNDELIVTVDDIAYDLRIAE